MLRKIAAMEAMTAVNTARDHREHGSGWNFAGTRETIAQAQPDRTALAHAPTRVSWREFDQQRANDVAARRLQAGCGHEDKVASHLCNRPAYVQAAFACMRVSLAPLEHQPPLEAGRAAFAMGQRGCLGGRWRPTGRQASRAGGPGK